ncbi:helix-turn-helix domain-containing protein [Streptomyces sp. NPDC048639]|uniref:helix-turn-helix domain-containing protein n=1 Tax=Streptomyces sp. NPDC048639 TaxID=3365581 RepID=UPI00371E7B97
MSERLHAVRALLTRPADLPSPAVRAKLRRAEGLTQQEVADAIGVGRVQVNRWEKGLAAPRQPHRDVYAELLKGLAEKHPTKAASDAEPSDMEGTSS